jgi:hypothetical protein
MRKFQTAAVVPRQTGNTKAGWPAGTLVARLPTRPIHDSQDRPAAGALSSLQLTECAGGLGRVPKCKKGCN